MNVASPVLLRHRRAVGCSSARRHRLPFLFAALVLVSAVAKGQIAEPVSSPRLVSVSAIDSTLVLDIRYATDHNFVGAPVDGYDRPLCLLTPEAAAALVRAHDMLSTKGSRLVVFDCYRPQRAVDHFVRWSYYRLDQKTKSTYYPNVDKRLLFELGYIASRSGHSRGSTVDVGLVGIDAPGDSVNALVDMGTPFDFFDPLSHTASPDITDGQRRNREMLLEAMRAAGFRNYPKEWWHFTLNGEPYPNSYFDVAVR